MLNKTYIDIYVKQDIYKQDIYMLNKTYIVC